MKAQIKLLSNGERVIIRPYRPADYRQVKSILQASGHFEPVWDSRQSLTLMAKQDPESILVVELEGEIIGNLYLHIHGHWAHIWRFVVAEDFRGLGVDRALMAEAMAIFRRRGIPEVAAFVNGADPRAEALLRYYRMNGWTIQEETFHGIWRKVEC